MFLSDFFSLIFPNICACCGNSLFKHEEVICNFCEVRLPKTMYHHGEENPVTEIFRGRSDIFSAAASYHFNKGNKVQFLVHQLKYKNRPDIGFFLGKRYGQDLRDSPFFKSADVIIPVPLHKKKKVKRGYNQSEQFANGLAWSMKIPVDITTLDKTKATETQTKKSRFKRWENVKEIFTVTDKETLKGQHILLVDDVITTGATIESCVIALQVIDGVRISIAAIAATGH